MRPETATGDAAFTSVTRDTVWPILVPQRMSSDTHVRERRKRKLSSLSDSKTEEKEKQAIGYPLQDGNTENSSFQSQPGKGAYVT
ncbi:hypothetical protein CDAR_221251 [Caerostris darwini]|uniref:Uncharacterized protein n=1 Tax=Caerostris darwini TaxID=1538125 RepID=A0AAV4WMA6_9ARAC|nr:hypothetical protein CDAR_221251 [Caerostris darwini]